MTDHMTIQDVAPIVRYLASGVQTMFDFNFPIFHDDEMHVQFGGVRQYAGFDVVGAGQSNGGRVTFDAPPPQNTIVTLMRRMVIERVSDFTEGGDFAAAAINTELDVITACMQQLAYDQTTMLHYADGEETAMTTLPLRAARAGKLLGFDGNGDPVPVAVGDGTGVPVAPDFIASGIGAVPRAMNIKMADMVSVKDFGAVGDGLTDDTLAFQRALAAHACVFVPVGVYQISSTLRINDAQMLCGAGQGSEIKTAAAIDLVHLAGSYAVLKNLKIFGGNVGVRLSGVDGPCVQNAVSDVTVWQAQTGILLDGGNNASKPVYWNNFARVLVAQPFVNGIHLMRQSAPGDTPNANRFMQCRVYSLGATTSGHGLYVEHGSFNNSFVDFESNVNGTAQACVRCGGGSNKTLFVNLYTESFNGVPNVRLDAGSIETAIYNLMSASDGAAIWDFSGGQYSAVNAGYPYKNRLAKSICGDMTSTLHRYDTEYIDTSGTVTLDLSHSVHLVSSFGGALTVKLPKASDAAGVWMVVKKIDASSNVITVSENSGAGPDGRNYYLGGENDYVCAVSNGAEWFVIATNRGAGNTRYFDGSGLYPIDMAVDVYLLSSFGGAMTARLPPANAPEAVGRRVTIKKTDVSSNVITVTVNGGSGPDGSNQTLTAQNQCITVLSNGGQWYVVGRYP